MTNGIIGREQEISTLSRCYESGKPEFVAVYGRRRVGKTFLIRQLFGERFVFSVTGIYHGTKQEQLRNFASALSAASSEYVVTPSNWFDAFDMLRNFLQRQSEGRKVLFFDELPWMETANSRFIKALELFWNSWGSGRSDLMLIVCGSATSWMHDKLIRAKGGLHNRLTRRILLQPFNLHETEDFLKAMHICWNRYQTVECYMILGGIPYYLSLLESDMSLSQNVDKLLFGDNRDLGDEYEMLYNALFDNPQKYVKVVETLFKAPEGLSRETLLERLAINDGGAYTKTLNDLEMSGIISTYPSFGKRKKGIFYRLTDFFTIFYLKFVRNTASGDKHFWSNMTDNPARRNWTGHAFELVCLRHTEQIKKKLGILGVLTETSTWRSGSGDKHLQIDLVINRRDEIINLCEMKYSISSFVIDKSYEETLRDKMETFRSESGTTKALHLTFVTTYGLKRNMYSSVVQSEVTMDDLFATL